MTIKVDKGIPIPSKKPRASEWRDLAMSLEIGDSVFFATHQEKEKARLNLRKYGWACTTRAVRNGYRIWAVERLRDDFEYRPN